MKFSDMMGKRDRSTAEVTEPEPPPEARTAPPVPDAPIRFGASRTELDEAVATVGGGTITPPAVAPPIIAPPAVAPPSVTDAPAPAAREPERLVTPPPPPPAPEAEPLGPPSISDVVAELAPRPTAAAANRQLDSGSWLDGIASIDDDLLPH